MQHQYSTTHRNKYCIRVLPTYPDCESTLVEGLRQGHNWAFVALYKHYSPSLLSILLRMVDDPTQAEDLLQDSFIKVWRNIHQYNPTQGRLFTWILNISRHTALDYIAKKNPLRYANDLATCPVQYLSVVSPNSASEVKQMVNTHLAEKYRVLVDLIYFQGYKQHEVAEHLRLPLGTVKTRLRLAIQNLRLVLSTH
ncbi:sigma-70 family RNA polymerase sigma factor [Nibrella saemangeumensis]|uniref:RNA polymerase sigma factor n=1 Tax=Nibrella saemangeumensis TaxID=1084526 RepID=A0ABP8NEQ4_9BACT